MLFSDAHAYSKVGQPVGSSVGTYASPEPDKFLPKNAILDYIKSYFAEDSKSSCKPNPKLLDAISNILIDLQNKGWDPKVVELCRTEAQQREKVEKGYSQTMHSKHLRGRAVDIVDKRYWWEIPTSHQFWKDLGIACKKQELIWGGDWKGFLDVAHCEMTEDQ